MARGLLDPSTLILAGLAVLGWLAWQFWGTNWVADRHQAEVRTSLEDGWSDGDDAVRTELNNTRTGTPEPEQVGRVITRLEANEQMLELRQTIVQALGGSFEVARRLNEAGNITDLDFARERALLEASKLALRSAEIAASQSREELIYNKAKLLELGGVHQDKIRKWKQ